MPDCPASSQSGTGMKKKLTMPEQVRYRTKPTQSCIFWVLYRNKILDARNADAGVSLLYTDAQLCLKQKWPLAPSPSSSLQKTMLGQGAKHLGTMPDCHLVYSLM
jgi:hypothetical protein